MQGVNTMLRVAKDVVAAMTTRQVNHLLLQDGEWSKHEDDPMWEVGALSGGVQDSLSKDAFAACGQF